MTGGKFGKNGKQCISSFRECDRHSLASHSNHLVMHSYLCFLAWFTFVSPELQTISISKALSGTEMPLKVKHARLAIIGTFHSRGAHSFWAVALRQPLQVCPTIYFRSNPFILLILNFCAMACDRRIIELQRGNFVICCISCCAKGIRCVVSIRCGTEQCLPNSVNYG